MEIQAGEGFLWYRTSGQRGGSKTLAIHHGEGGGVVVDLFLDLPIVPKLLETTNNNYYFVVLHIPVYDSTFHLDAGQWAVVRWC